jgi:propanediol dehydratase small subunit
MENQKYTLRKLCADDMFIMFRIISKIGMKDLRKCLAAVDVQAAISGKDVNAVGMAVAFEIAAVLMEHLPDCKKEIYTFLESLSGLKEKEIAALDMATFTQMIIDVIRKEEFRDFFTAVSTSFKQES